MQLMYSFKKIQTLVNLKKKVRKSIKTHFNDLSILLLRFNTSLKFQSHEFEGFFNKFQKSDLFSQSI